MTSLTQTLEQQKPTPEPKIEVYLRHIRNWVSVIGIIMLASVLAGVISLIAISVHDSNVNQQNSPNPSNISQCQSLGGTDPNC
jgi:hypothetical protein